MTDFVALTTPPPDFAPGSFPLPPLSIGPKAEDWEQQGAALAATWREFLGHGPEPVPLDFAAGEEEDLDGVKRTLVSYAVEPDCRVEAYLLQPAGEGPFPGVVVFHPTTNETIRQPAGLAAPPGKHFGLTLARRGYVALCPRNYLWDYRGRPGPEPTFGAFAALVKEVLLTRYPHWTGMGKMVWDGLRAVDALLTRPEVDPARLGCVGHSLGAKEVLYSMAFDPRLRAGVSSEGGLGLPFTNWSDPWYLGPGLKDRPDLEHHQLLALTAPRALLVLGGGLEPSHRAAGRSPGADPIEDWAYLEAARPAYRLLGAPERLGLYLHDQGHWVPPDAEAVLYDWFDRFLG